MALNKEVKKMVYQVYCFMKKDASNAAVVDFKQYLKRTAEATNCPLSLVQRIVKYSKNSLPLVFRDSTIKRKKLKTADIDSFNQGIIRRIICNFPITEKVLPTLKMLRKKLQDDLNFYISETSLRQILKKMNFTWKRTNTRRKILIEKSRIRLQRIEYLRNIKKYRDEGRPIIYADELYIDDSHLSCRSSTDKLSEDVKKPLLNDNHLVIVHAGGESGFVPNALLTFNSDRKSGENINPEKYENWVCAYLVPNLPPNSVVVFDNASYHNKQFETAPTSHAKREDMQIWLKQKEIKFNESMLKPELYSLIKKYKQQFKKFKIDAILNKAGHSVIRLPPQHQDLNPIELVWSQIKEFIASKNVKWDLTHINDLAIEKIKSITPSDWEKLCTKIKEIEDEYTKCDQVVDMLTEACVVHAGGADSDSNDDVTFRNDSDDEVDSDDASPYGFHMSDEDEDLMEEDEEFILP